MTDRYKGFLVTLEKDIRSDDAENMITAIQMIKGVYSVKPYVSNLEDMMSYQKGSFDVGRKIIEYIGDEIFQLKKECNK